MPCYDSRSDANTSEGRAEMRKDFRHNSDVAEMLCGMCRVVEARGLFIPTDVYEWWKEHKARDAARKARLP